MLTPTNLKMIYKPYPYQQRAIDFIEKTHYCALFLDMGLGKTVITLTAIKNLIASGEIKKVLVIAPKLVAENTWSQEIEKWDHTNITYSIIIGTPQKRLDAIDKDVQLYVIGRDNIKWMIDTKTKVFYDMIVLDELTSFKNRKSLRWKAIKKIRPFVKRVVGLTGTPTPNGMRDLWGQMYCIDQGVRLETTQGRFYDLYFDTFVKDFRMIRCDLKKGADVLIRSKIKDITLSMQAKDYLQLPKLIVQDIRVRMNEKEMREYKKFEKENVLNLIDTNENVIAVNAAALCSKLSQYANGFVYDENHNYTIVNKVKLEALQELIEQAQDNNILLFYQFQADAEIILKQIKGAKKYENGKDLTDWNKGKIHILLAHPANLSYGLNLQYGGHIIVWYGTGWNSELYSQACARLYRQGQTKPVYVYRILCDNTIDNRQLYAIQHKIKEQDALIDYLKYKINEEVYNVTQKDINPTRRTNVYAVARIVGEREHNSVGERLQATIHT